MTGGIACPACGDTTGQSVTDSRPSPHGVLRRRKRLCGMKFSTYEIRQDQWRRMQEMTDALRAVMGVLAVNDAPDAKTGGAG